ncbi:hypothetical protein JZU68_09870, partial [bacterium]|nr:hypothetical protein [bacterium]
MNNCIVKNLSLSNGRVFNYVMQTGVTPAVYGDLTVTNSEFNNFGTSIINSGVIGLSPNNTLFSNCLFV